MISRKGSYFDIFRALKGYEKDQGLEPWIKTPKAHEELKISCSILPKKKKKILLNLHSNQDTRVKPIILATIRKLNTSLHVTTASSIA